MTGKPDKCKSCIQGRAAVKNLPLGKHRLNANNENKRAHRTQEREGKPKMPQCRRAPTRLADDAVLSLHACVQIYKGGEREEEV